ncbi:type II toxin-antitoxin system Phd/YefM family antitoxin [Mycolicibacterium hodleri]|uniref:Antitoxin n=1 Tax=Mycolicibacterium hodleri TaxID=49897 RepID=A0A502E9S2_9MYCO|nr:type II toxin-antitoxin system Phd/YefM family antitoxin [Mycolicibacterium hodleri]
MTDLRRHFGRILDEVQRGQTFVITRRRREVALLVPASEYSRTSGRPQVDDDEPEALGC